MNEQKLALNRLQQGIDRLLGPDRSRSGLEPRREARATQRKCFASGYGGGRRSLHWRNKSSSLVTANITRERQRITTADREFRISLGWSNGDRFAVRVCDRRRDAGAHARSRAPITDRGIGTSFVCLARFARPKSKSENICRGSCTTKWAKCLPDCAWNSRASLESTATRRAKSLRASLSAKGDGGADAANRPEYCHAC